MPKAIRKPCTQPGCPALVQSGRCPKHQAQSYREQDERRESSSARGYDATWRKLRVMKLNADPLCEECSKTKQITEANEVDHKIRIRDWPEGRLVFENLQSLCKSCHSRKTIGEALGRKFFTQ